MKFALVALLTVVLAACGGNEEGSKEKADKPKDEKTSQDENKAKMEELKKKMEKQQIDKDKVVAKVNDTEIKGDEYNRALSQFQIQYQQMGQDPTSDKLSKQIEEQVVQSLVDYELILQAAEGKGYTASDEEVEKKLKSIKDQYKEDKKFEEALKQNKLTEKELKAQLTRNLTYEKFVEKEVPAAEVSEKEMKDYYNKFKEKAKGQQAPPYEDVKAQIKTQLENQQKQEQVTKKIKQLKDKADVKVMI